MKRRGSISTILVTVVVLVLLSATAYMTMAAVIGRKVANGEKLLAEKQYAMATEEFKKAEKYSKYFMRKNPDITKGLAESSYELEDYDSAQMYYEQLAVAEPDSAETHYKLGLLSIRAKDLGKTLEQIRVLEEMRTFEALDYATDLTDKMRRGELEGMLKEMYDNAYDKIIPKLRDIPGRVEEMLDKIPGKKKGETEPESEISADSDIKQEEAEDDALSKTQDTL